MTVYAVKDGVHIKSWASKLEEDTLKQAENVARLPFVHHHVALMPDAHFGYGVPIGGVFASKGVVIPNAVGVDIGCFTGDTKVPLLKGGEMSLKDMAESKEVFHVYSVDADNNITGAEATSMKTREDMELVEVVIDNGERIRCTKDHKFMLRDGSYKEAQFLHEGASLMPFRKSFDKDGYERVYNPKTKDYIKTTWMLALTGVLGEVCKNPGAEYWHQIKNHPEETKYIVRGQGEKAHNHKVVSVELLSVREDVYCLSVPIHHNFAISSGVFVHNCGMRSVKTSLHKDAIQPYLKDILSGIRDVIPLGTRRHKFQQSRGISDKTKKTLCLFNSIVDSRYKDSLYQVGTLGGGNHFIEVQYDTEGKVYLMLHSGSRNLGYTVAKHYNEKAKELNARWFSSVDRSVELSFLPVDDPLYMNYLADMNACVEYASVNREVMMDRIQDVVEGVFGGVEFEEQLDVAHNYARLENHYGKNVMVHRKGAISAKDGEIGIIPGSQGSNSYIVRGLGNKESFTSASHGAGRAMGRKEAKRSLDLGAEQKRLEAMGVVHTIRSIDTLDEAPSAYKDIEVVMKNQSGLVEIVTELSPMACIKG